MSIGQDLLPEFDQEMAHTRRELERIPEDKISWKPHEKSMSMLRLSGHIAEIPGWTGIIIQTDSLDVAPIGGPAYQPTDHKNRASILEVFDKKVSEGRQALTTVSDETLHRAGRCWPGAKPSLPCPNWHASGPGW